MHQSIDIQKRKPVWIALSDLYLDTELQESGYRHLALALLKSNYSWEELTEINKNEVFPVLYSNLLSVAGEWGGFDEDWLLSSITKSLAKKNSIINLSRQFTHFVHKNVYKENWNQLEKVYKAIKRNKPKFSWAEHDELTKIQTKVKQLAFKIGAPEKYLPTYGYTKDFAHPHIEVDESKTYYWVVIERGQEFNRKTTTNLNELYFWIFEMVTATMASDFLISNNKDIQVQRRVLYAKQEELMGCLNKNWEAQIKAYNKAISNERPFKD